MKQEKLSGNMSKLKLKNESLLVEYSPTKELADEKLIAEAIWECMKSNDPEGVVEVIKAHLEAVNKLKHAKDANLPRSTLYNALKRKNPTIGTLSKMVNCCLEVA